MRATAFVGGLVLLAMTAVGAAAQQQELDSVLAYVNETLTLRQFTDGEGETTVSRVEFAKGVLRVFIEKTKDGNRFTNRYEIGWASVDEGAVSSRSRSGHLEISLGALGPVRERMDCLMAGGAKTGWDLPDRRRIWVELDGKAPEVRELGRALSHAIAMAKADPRYGGS
jgi:hypothetical protein